MISYFAKCQNTYTCFVKRNLIILAILIFAKTANATLYQIEPRDSVSTSASTNHYNVEFYSNLASKNLAGQFNGFLINNYSERDVAGAKEVSFSVLNYSVAAGALTVFDAEGNIVEARPFSGYEGVPSSILDGKLPYYFFREAYLSLENSIAYKTIFVDGNPKYIVKCVTSYKTLNNTIPNEINWLFYFIRDGRFYWNYLFNRSFHT